MRQRSQLKRLILLSAALLAGALGAQAGYNTYQDAAVAMGQSALGFRYDADSALDNTNAIGFFNPNDVQVSTTLAKTFVVDRSNHRVLIYNTTAPVHGQAADVVLGHPNFTYNAYNDNGFNVPVAAPNANRLSDPRSVYIINDSSLAVADTANHRVLIWNSIPVSNGQAADLVLGQPDLLNNTANIYGLSAATMWAPTHVTGSGSKLIVTDNGNHRVLVWDTIPTVNQAPANLVLGQQDFVSNAMNSPSISSQTFRNPTVSFYDGTRLFVADTNNNRVLVWNAFPSVNGQGADVVLGHPLFSYDAACDNGSNVNNWGRSASNLYVPQGVVSDGTRLYVSDTGSSRVLIWDTMPAANFASADHLLGQQFMTDGNPRGASDKAVYPLGIALSDGTLLVTDVTNNRVMVWDPPPASDYAAASRAFGHRGDQRSEFFTRAPQAGASANGLRNAISAITAAGKTFIADSYNNRVLGFNAVPLASGASADFILGQSDFYADYVPLLPNASNFYTPAEVASDGTRLVVADQNNNRVLIWNSIPTAGNQPADVVVGQPNFQTNTCRYGAVPAAQLCGPTSAFSDGRRLFVVDNGSARVLIWNSMPVSNYQPADVVLGHPNFTYTVVNDNGGNVTGSPSASNLNSPRNVFSDGERLYVTDASNHRLLIWNGIPAVNGQAADLVLGHPNFTYNVPTDNGAGVTGSVSAANLTGPVGVAGDGKRLYVTDGQNRVLIYDPIPAANGAAAARVLGQPNLASGAPGHSAKELFFPYGASNDGPNLYIASTYHNRVQIWKTTAPVSNYAYINVSTLTVAGTLTQGTTAAFLRVDAWSGGGQPVLRGLRVYNDTATVDSALLAHWYLDNQNDGTSYTPNPDFNESAESLMESANFSGSSATFTTQFTLDVTTVTFWVALSLKDLPYPQASLAKAALRLHRNYTSFRMSGSDELASVLNTVVPSEQAQTADNGDTVTVSSAASSQIPAVVSLNQPNIPMARIELKTLGDYAFLRQVKVWRTGTTANSDQTAAIYLDSDANGVFDAATDAAWSAPASFIGSGYAAITLTSLVQLSTAPRNIFVVAQINSNTSSIGKYLGVYVDSSSFIMDTGSPDTMDNPSILPYLSPQATIYSAVSDVTTSISSNAWTNAAKFIFVGNFGSQNVSVLHYVWDNSPTHAWTGTETVWSSGNSTRTATADLSWYFHVNAFDAAGSTGTTQDLGPYFFDGSSPAAAGFASLSSTGASLGETQWNMLALGVTAQITVQDVRTGLAVSTGALAFAGDGHDNPGFTSGYGVMYSTNAGASWIDWSTYTATLSGTSETRIESLAAFNGKLYAGTYPAAKVYSSADGENWTPVLTGTGESSIASMFEFKGKLYAGTSGSGKIYSTSDGTTWTPVLSGTGEGLIGRLAVFKGKLYAGTSSGGKLYSTSDGTTWTPAGLSGQFNITSLSVFNGKLYAVSYNDSALNSTSDGINWSKIWIGNIAVLSVFNGKLYAGGSGGGVYSSPDGATWTSASSGIGSDDILSFSVFNGKLYAGTYQNSRLFATADGAAWTLALSVPGEAGITSMSPFNGKLYAGTATSGKILQISPVSASLTGADGDTGAQTLTANGLSFVMSTNTQTCAGSAACGATNQVKFTVSDMLGNVRTANYAVLVDTMGPVSVSTLSYPANGQYVNTQPNFNWIGPSTTTISRYAGQAFYVLQVSTNDPAFATTVINISTPALVLSTSVTTGEGTYISTYTLADNTTYYWRVATRNNFLGSQGSWSQVYSFVTDFTSPTASGFLTYNSTSGTLGEEQWNNLASGVTVQMTVQDLVSGLAVSTSALWAGSDGHDLGGVTSGFSVKYTTNAGASWIEGAGWAVSNDGNSIVPGTQAGWPITVLGVYNGKLYASAYAMSNVGIFDGTTWSISGLGQLYSFAVYNGKLYAGVYPGNVLVFDGTTWSDSNGGGVVVPGESIVRSLGVYNGKLYAGTTGTKAAVFDGASWSAANGGSVLISGTGDVNALAAYNGRLYASLGNGQVAVFDGASWSATSGASEMAPLIVYNGKLYAGTWSGKVFVFDGTTWSATNGGSAIFPGAASVGSFAIYNGKLYAGAAGAKAAVFDGASWSAANGGNELISGGGGVGTLAVYNGKLYAGPGPIGKAAEMGPISASLTGSDGITTGQTLSSSLSLAQSTNTQTCGGSSACGATNQVRFTVTDMAGNVRSVNYAVLVDVLSQAAVSTLTYPANGQSVNVQPNFNWIGPSTTTIAGYEGRAVYILQVSTNDPNFATTVINISTPAVVLSTSLATAGGTYISTYTLAGNTTYYWRVATRNNALGTQSPWSQVYSFVTDFASPTASGFLTYNSTSGALGEAQWNNLASGVTAQISVQDAFAGLAVSSAALAFAGDGRDGPSSAGGYGVMYTTTSGQYWIDASTVIHINPGGSFFNIQTLAVFNGKFYEGDTNGRVNSSADGETWTDWAAVGGSIQTLTVFNGKLYAGDNTGRVYSSTNGVTWTAGTTVGSDLRSLAVFNGKLYAGDYNTGGKVYASADGVTWTTGTAVGVRLYSLAVFNGKLYAGDNNNGNVYSSADGVNWTTGVAAGSRIASLAVFNGRLYAGDYGNARVHSSADGVNWTAGTVAVGGMAFAVFNGKIYTAGGDRVYSSVDGMNWTPGPVLGSAMWTLAVFNGKLYSGNYSNYGGFYQITPLTAALTGADGATAGQTLTAAGLNLAGSTNTVTCGGSAACGATNQVLFTASDMAGNVRTANYAVLVRADLPAGCGAGYNVSKNGLSNFTNIQAAVNALRSSPVLSTTTCVVIRDTATYAEQVTIQGFSGARLSIMGDPSFVSSAPVISPPVGSTAAFQVMNSSVSLLNLRVVATNVMPYGIVVSSDYVVMSSVTITDPLPGSSMTVAGLYLAASYAAVSNSTVTVSFDPLALWVAGSSNTVTLSSITNNGYGTAYRGPVTLHATALSVTGNYNQVSQSTVTGGNGISPVASVNGGDSYAVSITNGIGNSLLNLFIIPGGGGGGNRTGSAGGAGATGGGGGGAASGGGFGGNAYVLYLNNTSFTTVSGININEAGGVGTNSNGDGGGGGASGGAGGSGGDGPGGGSAYAVYLNNSSSDTFSGVTITQSGGVGGKGNTGGGGGASGGAGAGSAGFKGSGAYVFYFKNVSSGTFSGISITQSGGTGGDGGNGFGGGGGAAGGGGGGLGVNSGGAAYAFYVYGSSYNSVSNSSITIIGGTPGIGNGGVNGSSATSVIALLAGSVGNTFSNIVMSGANGVVIDSQSGYNTVRNSTITSRMYSPQFAGYQSSGSYNTATQNSFSGYYGAILAPGANSNTVSLSTITGAYYGISIATQTGVSISSLAFHSLQAGATAINFLGGTFNTAFPGIYFDTSMAVNVNASPLSPGSLLTMSGPQSPGYGRALSNDPFGYVRWPSYIQALAQTAISTPAYPSGYISTSTFTFNWVGPSTSIIAGLGAIGSLGSGLSLGASYYLQVSAANDPTFISTPYTVSITTPAVVQSASLAAGAGAYVSISTLTPGTAYYWRVSAVSGIDGSISPWSSTMSFTLDAASPTASAFVSYSSTGGALDAAQWNNLAYGVTVQISVQDPVSGLAVSTVALKFPGDGHDSQEQTSGYGAMYSTNAGQNWIDYSTYNFTSWQADVNAAVSAMAVFGGKLYAGASGNVYRSATGTSGWSQVLAGIPGANSRALAIFNGKLYTAVDSYNNGKVFSTSDGDSWTQVGSFVENSLWGMAVFNGKLYLGAYGSTHYYVTADGSNWTMLTAPEFMASFAVFNGKLYAGSGINGTVYSSADGVNWALVASPGGGGGGVYALAVFNGKLYAGGRNGGNTVVLASSPDGTNWTAYSSDIWTLTGGNNHIDSFAVANGKLYAGTGSTNGRVLVTDDGVTWYSQMNPGINPVISSLIYFNGKLYAGNAYAPTMYEIIPLAASLTGSDGNTAAQTLAVTGLNLVMSTNTQTCNGSASCWASNQVKFTSADMAGNVRATGRYSVLVDTVTPIMVAPADNATGVSQAPGLHARVLGAGTSVQYQYQVDTLPAMNSQAGSPLYSFDQSAAQMFADKGAFSGQDATIQAANDSYLYNSTATFSFYSTGTALSQNTRYYWRVRAKTGDRNYFGQWSSTASFTTGQFASQNPVNHLAISGISLSGFNNAVNISFIIAENNVTTGTSAGGGAYNTADWVFVKYSTMAGADGSWNHATLIGGSVSAGATLTTASDNKGVFLDHTASSVYWTAGATVTWNMAADVGGASTATVRVFAVSMVRVPQGSFVYNAAGAGGSSYNNYGGGSQVTVASANDIPSGAAAGWPNGYGGFYIGRYEVTQGQYADFLNTLPSVQALGLYEAIVSSGHNISYTSGNPYGSRYAAADPSAAKNYLSTLDAWSLLSWAALRPMTEMEFEKAARDISPDARAYPWGDTAPDTVTYTPSNEGGTCIRKYLNFNNTAGCRKVLNVGRYMSGDVYRGSAETGASPWGIADLAGNTWEQVLNCSDTSVPANGNGTITPPGSWPGASATSKGVRGGAFYDDATIERVSARPYVGWPGTNRDPTVGVRGCRTP